MDFSKQKQITADQQKAINDQEEKVENLNNHLNEEIAAIREKLNRKSNEDRSFMETQLNQLKQTANEHDSEIDRKLEELYNWRIEASKGQATIETKLEMLEKNMLLQFEQLNKKLDERSS